MVWQSWKNSVRLREWIWVWKLVFHSQSGEIPTQHSFRVRWHSARTSDCLSGSLINARRLSAR